MGFGWLSLLESCMKSVWWCSGGKSLSFRIYIIICKVLVVLFKLMGLIFFVILCCWDVVGGSWVGIMVEFRLFFKKVLWFLGNKWEDEVVIGLRLRGIGGLV